MRATSPLVLAASLLLASAALAAGRPAVVVKNDGTRLGGTLLEQGAQGFLIQTEGGLFLVPFSEVDHLEYGAKGDDDPATTVDDPSPAAPLDAPSPAADDAAPAAAVEAPISVESPQARADPGGSWVVVLRRDGTSLSGVLRSRDDQELVVLSGPDEITVPMEDVVRLVSGELSEAKAPPRPGPRPATEPWVPPPPRLRLANPLLQARLHPEFGAYQQERLQLVDGGGYWIGPRKLGYRRELFGADVQLPFHAVVAGEPEHRLAIPELLDLVGDRRLRRRYDRSLALATARGQLGVVMTVVGAALSSVAIASTVAAAAGDDPLIAGEIATPMTWLGLPHLAGGAVLLATSRADRRRLAGVELSALAYRRRVWAGIERYNAHLRDRYGLPDYEELDAPTP